MLSYKQQIIKRFVDIVFSLLGITLSLVPMLTLIITSTISTKSFGVFYQKRVGRNAKLFTMFKIKTMREVSINKFVVTKFGRFLRNTKLDELPQLFNVLIGDMSIVGPRPDIEGYADVLENKNLIILSVKPGITGPATLKFSNEEAILSKQENPLEYNDTVLWSQKVEINKDYVREWSLMRDFKYMYLTALQLFRNNELS